MSTFPLGAIRVRNALKRINPDLTIEVKNVNINGSLFGASGFVTAPNGRVVYINTDHNHMINTQALFRTAQHTKDYTGGQNQYCAMDVDVLADKVFALLHDKHHNLYAVEGATRCDCGSKYWEYDRCVDCGSKPN
jgi:hypothetical protein